VIWGSGWSWGTPLVLTGAAMLNSAGFRRIEKSSQDI
jgi:hypothetical protein